MEQVVQKGCGYLLPGSVQGQIEWGSEQLGLVGDLPAYSKGIGTRCLKGPFQLNHSMILQKEAEGLIRF